MTAPTQQNRPFRLETPLGADTLLLVRFTGEERVSTLFRFVVEAWSRRSDIAPSDLLLKNVTLYLQLGSGSERKVSGIVARMVRGASAPDGWFAYELVIVPKHWVLTADREFDIWQEKTVKDICNALYEDVAVEWKLQGSYEPRPYTFRYRESRWQCASRLLEQYGIWYRFDHATAGAKLVLHNTPTGVEEAWGLSSMGFHDGVQTSERLTSLRAEYVPYVAKSEVRSYSEFKVDGNIAETTPAVGNLKLPAHVDAHYFDNDISSMHSGIAHGGSERAGDVQKLFQTIKAQANLRQQEAESETQRFIGSGTYAGLQSGAKVKIAKHAVDAFNGEYFVVAVRHDGHNGSYIAGDRTEARYENQFECIPMATPFRPKRTTPWPQVSGTHLGVVVGPSGEEIFTDKYGRVQVAFRWDGKAASTDRACWIRVAQPWAGSKFGAVFLPRIGHEVLVDFVDGNPDQPVVVGSVYNNVNMPPWVLPDNRTQTGVRSHSSLNGGADEFNELRFEDKKGSELVYMQAQKDLTTLVKNDEKRDVLHDRTTTIRNIDTETVEEGDDITTVKKGKQIITVEDNDREINVAKNQKVDIGDNETITIGANLDLTVGGNETITIRGNNTSGIDGDNSETVKGDETIKVDGKQTVGITGNQSIKVEGNVTIELPTGNYDLEAKAGKVNIKATAGIKLTCGANSIEITPAGVTIKGAMVKVEGTGMAQIKAPMTQVNGDGMLMLKGGITMIN